MKAERKMDRVYFKSLNDLVDHLFEVASKQQWTWDQIAKESGLAKATIYRLGMGLTRYPQFRTVELLSYSLGGSLRYTKSRHQGTASSTKERRWILKFLKAPKAKRLKVA
jgi:DNA-binding phage protein